VRAEFLLLLVFAGGCGAVHVLTRPEGDGGWSVSERRERLDASATRAAVSLDAAPVPPPDHATLTLPDVLRLAAANRRVVEADRSLAIARADVDQARGRFFPSVTGRGSYDRYTDPQSVAVDIPASALPAGTPLVIREQDFFTVNGTATVPIDVFGTLTKNLTAAQAGYRAEEARRFGVLLGEQVAATRSYFGLLEAERLTEVARQTLEAERQQLRNAEARVAEGRLTRNELLVVQVAVRNTEQLLRRLELRASRARWTLNQLIGRPIDAPLGVADVVARPALPSSDEALREALTGNVALRVLLEEQQRLEDAAAALARGRLPRLQGGGTIDYSTQQIIRPQRIGGGFLGFTWDVLDAPRDAEIAKARIAIDRNRTRIEQTLREVEAAVRATHGAAEERLAALATAEAAVVQAEENRRIRAAQFDVGRATSEDLLDAEALLAQQRAALATSRYQAHVRAAELEQLIGRPLASIDAPPR
jgi:outer membrane protein